MKLIGLLPVIALGACATSALKPTNTDFSMPASPELARSFELRARYSAPMQFGSTAIYVDSVSVHHLREETSTVVWRDQHGKWLRSQVTEVGPGGLLAVERTLESAKTVSLTPAQGLVLERLIRRQDLYSGKVVRTGEIAVGAYFHTMAIVTPFGRTTLEWNGRLLGSSGAVADIVLGHP